MKKAYSLTNEELFNLPEYRILFESAFGTLIDDFFYIKKITKDRSNSKNYKPNIYFHGTGGFGEYSIGEGLYLGKDKNAIHNFYNGEGEFGIIQQYKGNPHFLDLTLPNALESFEQQAIKKFSKLPKNNHLKKATLENGFDGIRYFDPITTGEEFVLYNTSKVKLITKHKKFEDDTIIL